MEKAFRRRLLRWYRTSHRDLPWRATSDPYLIWLSEIMLQQTRVATAIPYFERFRTAFPNVQALASAQENDVLQLWAGLGYYSRARNMLKAAREIGTSRFPSEYESIRALPGIGDYTAAAVSSIAFGTPKAAVDGNVLRVLARVLADSGDISHPETRRRLALHADRLLDRASPGDYNQALMELGATICVPKIPLCQACPLQKFCKAFENGQEKTLPIKLRRAPAQVVERTLLIAQKKDRLLFWQRPASASKLAGFWELPEPEHLVSFRPSKELGTFRHSITNQRFHFSVLSVSGITSTKGLHWLSPSVLYLFSTTTRKALKLAGFRGF